MQARLRDVLAGSSGEKAGDFVIQYGQEILIAAALFLIGLIAVKLVIAWLRKTLPRIIENQYFISTVITGLNILLIVLVLSLTLHFLGMRDVVLERLLFAVALVTIAFILLLRPYIPTPPFKIGNMIDIGGLKGKVEAMSFTHTRLKTFDGKTLFVPNQMLFKTVINNFHYTPTRRVEVKVGIGYKDDLLKAKQVLTEILESDPRASKKPAPTVYVMELGDNGVILSARCWVQNTKFLRVKSDLTERIKLRFDEEGISIPFPQRHLHMEGGLTALCSRGVGAEPGEVVGP